MNEIGLKFVGCRNKNKTNKPALTKTNTAIMNEYRFLLGWN